jgi:hypothetical protein
MKKTIDYAKLKYSIDGREGFSFSLALRLWKTRYNTLEDFKRAIITHEGLTEFYNLVADMWDDIKPVTVEEALQVENTEQRRTYFTCIGVEKLFKEMKPKLLNRQEVNKKRKRWDDKNDPYEYKFKDVYELYEIPASKLFTKEQLKNTLEWNIERNNAYAVRCWCTTTNREYWIYVPRDAALGNRWKSEDDQADAIGAIAWTIRINISNPERIYRQGDIIVAKASEKSLELPSFRHLTKDQYLKLMYSET